VPALLANTITPRRAIKNYQLNSLINLRYVALRPSPTRHAVVGLGELSRKQLDWKVKD